MTAPPRALPASRRDWQRILADAGVRPNKGRGQNFLVDAELIERILDLADLHADDAVVEIGPGLGALTGPLLRRVARVTAVEIDWTLAGYLRTAHGDDPRLELIQQDVMAVDLAGIFAERPTKVISNLPYSAAAAIVRCVLETIPAPVSLTVMVQREVAERMLAEPPDMSILSVATQAYATAEMGFVVPPDVFLPEPEVESAVIVLRPHAEPVLGPGEAPGFFRLVSGGFRHKRKNIANSLEHELKAPKADIVDRLLAVDIAPTRRAETLSIDEWLTLYRSWSSSNSAAR